jgi:hypothetical protein
MAENKMEEVATMFGKKLGEEFIVQLENGMKRVAYFSDKGLHICGTRRFVVSDTALKELLTGRAEIVEG